MFKNLHIRKYLVLTGLVAVGIANEAPDKRQMSIKKMMAEILFYIMVLRFAGKGARLFQKISYDFIDKYKIIC